jgi:hypothetical protein
MLSVVIKNDEAGILQGMVGWDGGSQFHLPTSHPGQASGFVNPAGGSPHGVITPYFGQPVRALE